jgi:hypothetical protein
MIEKKSENLRFMLICALFYGTIMLAEAIVNIINN